MPHQAVDDSLIRGIIEKDIIQLLKLDDLPLEKQEQYRKQAGETIYNRAFSRITKMLEDKGVFEKFQEGDRDEANTRKFLQENDIDLDRVLAEEALAYKTQMKLIADILDSGIDIKAG